VQRTIAGTIVFALGATLVTALSSVLAYDRVRDAFQRDFERRLESVARTSASQIAPNQVEEIRGYGQEADLYGNVIELFVSLRQAGGVADVSLVDTTGTVLADVAAAALEGRRSPLLAVSDRAWPVAHAGRIAASPVYADPRSGKLRRAAWAPVPGPPSGPHVVALVAVEADVDYEDTLDGLRRSLVIAALVSLGALALVGTLFVRRGLAAARLERRLTRAQNLAAMGQMTATLAHEIRNPLGVIRNAATRLGQLDPEARTMADFVIEEADRLNKTLNRYLEFARGDEDPAAGEGDARQALRATLNLLEGEMRQRGIALESDDVGDGSAPVRVDNESLKQVFLNIVLNALDAMPQGGRLRVAMADRRGHFEIVLEDTGKGMAPEVLQRAGEPFFTTKARGSGLGLVLSKRLLMAGGGELRVESLAGRGTTCTVALPRRGA